MNEKFIETFIEVYNEMQKDKCDTGEEAVAHDSITKLIPFLDENKMENKMEQVKNVVLDYFRETRCNYCKSQEQEDIKIIDTLVDAVKELNENKTSIKEENKTFADIFDKIITGISDGSIVSNPEIYHRIINNFMRK